MQFIILIIVLILIIITNIKIVPQSKTFVIERLGSYKSTWQTGLHFKIPFIERIANNVSLKENSFNFNLIYYSLLGDVYDKYAEFLALPKLPKTKIYKILTDEDYRRECHVFNLPEREFIKLYVKCFEMDKPSVMYKNMENLINYYYEKQGGFNIRTFKLKNEVEGNDY